MAESIYLHQMPRMVNVLRGRSLPLSDQNGSDLFLELRALYLLAMVKEHVGDEAWLETRRQCPYLLQNVIRGRWSIPWDSVGDLEWLRSLLPHAFP